MVPRRYQTVKNTIVFGVKEGEKDVGASGRSSKKAVKAKLFSPPPASSTTPYSDIDLNHWRDYDEIETDSLWLFDSRKRQDGHQLDYHGNCVPQILTQCLTRFTKADDVVLDLFLGSGTTAIEAVNLGRRCIGVELKKDLVQYVRKKLKAQDKLGQVEIINGSSTNQTWTGKAIQRALGGMDREKAQFLFLHPPYADIIRFSESEECLSNVSDTEDFLNGFEQVAQLGYDQLEKGRFAALVIGDKYTDGQLIPLGFYCMERMNRVGFKTKSIIVKNITGNERGKGRTGNLWRYRALKGGFYIFKHEYVMIFQK